MKGKMYIRMVVGTLLMAVGTNFFLEPVEMVPGGFTGLAIILQHLTSRAFPGGIPVWLGNILLNIPLILAAIKVRGWAFMRRTLAASILFSWWLFVVPTMDFANGNLFLIAVFGGAFMGVGLGLVFLGRATTGGTDTVAALLQKLMPQVSVARILPYLDGVVILLAMYFIGVEVSLYAVVTVVLCGRIADEIITGSKNACCAYIISDYYEEISHQIMTGMNRGVTRLSGTGMYTGSEKPVLFCAISLRETAALKDLVFDIDDRAFVIMSDAREVRGEGFMEYSREEL